MLVLNTTSPTLFPVAPKALPVKIVPSSSASLPTIPDPLSQETSTHSKP
jgi:hypothetical protein